MTLSKLYSLSIIYDSSAPCILIILVHILSLISLSDRTMEGTLIPLLFLELWETFYHFNRLILTPPPTPHPKNPVIF